MGALQDRETNQEKMNTPITDDVMTRYDRGMGGLGELERTMKKLETERDAYRELIEITIMEHVDISDRLQCITTRLKRVLRPGDQSGGAKAVKTVTPKKGRKQ